jgi:predicted nucleic acid-binding protein
MLSVGLVIDTNVLVSAALKLDSLQRTAFLLATTKPARLYVSAPVLDDCADVLSRPELGSGKGFANNCFSS